MSPRAQNQPILNPQSCVGDERQVSSSKPGNKELKPTRGPDAYESLASGKREPEKESKEESR